jgi:transcriptional regulator with XRE-family HTH domain
MAISQRIQQKHGLIAYLLTFLGSVRLSMDNLALFGNRLRAIRGKRSRVAVAEAARISVGYLGELERGEKWPALDVIVQLASALAVSPASLFEFEPEQANSQILLGEIASLMEKRDTRQLQLAVRVLKSLHLDS